METRTRLLKKGDKVKIIHDGANASQFNELNGCDIMGIYSINDGQNKIFEIQGELQIQIFDHDKKVYGAYLLTLNGKKIGYVYNTFLKRIIKTP